MPEVILLIEGFSKNIAFLRDLTEKSRFTAGICADAAARYCGAGAVFTNFILQPHYPDELVRRIKKAPGITAKKETFQRPRK